MEGTGARTVQVGSIGYLEMSVRPESLLKISLRGSWHSGNISVLYTRRLTGDGINKNIYATHRGTG